MLLSNTFQTYATDIVNNTTPFQFINKTGNPTNSFPVVNSMTQMTIDVKSAYKNGWFWGSTNTLYTKNNGTVIYVDIERRQPAHDTLTRIRASDGSFLLNLPATQDGMNGYNTEYVLEGG